MHASPGTRVGRRSLIVPRPPLKRGSYSFPVTTTPTNMTLPAGTQVGDTVFVIHGGGYQITAITGAACIHCNNSEGHNFQIFRLKVTQAHITAGYIAVTYGGSFACATAILVFQGNCVMSFRDVVPSFQNTLPGFNWSSPQVVTPDEIYFAWLSCRASSTLTSSNGTRIEFVQQSNASGALFQFPTVESPEHIDSVFTMGTPNASFSNIFLRFGIKGVIQ